MKKFFFYLCLFFAPVFAGAQSIDTYIHPRAVPLLPIIKEQTEKYAPGLKSPWVVAAIIDHETCPGYKSSKCWSPFAELRNSREHGLGLLQMTRTWNADGSIRFDNIRNLRNKYPVALGELDWDTYKHRVDLQLRSGTILFYEEYQRLRYVTDESNRLHMSRSAYNGGGGRVAQARSKCKLITNCNTQIWYDNVEKHLPQSRTPIKNYGNRSPYEINTHYVKDTGRRLNKFKPYFTN